MTWCIKECKNVLKLRKLLEDSSFLKNSFIVNPMVFKLKCLVTTLCHVLSCPTPWGPSMTSLPENVQHPGENEPTIKISSTCPSDRSSIAMDFNFGDLEMVNAGCFNPLTTQFLLMEGNNPCPRFYGKVEDKKKVYHALKNELHPEEHAKWKHLKCHCQLIPKMRLGKTARNLNKVFLICGASATEDSSCKYFQWIRTPLYPLASDPMPEWLVKSSSDPTNQGRSSQRRNRQHG